jgi:hypothetical protein
VRRVAQLLLACFLALAPILDFELALADPTPTATDVLYLIDVSGSMVGKGVTYGNILADLTGALTEEVNVTTAGTDVFVATFADGLVDVDGPASETYQPVRRFTIDPADPDSSREAIITYILGLDPWVRAQAASSGQRTALYASALSTLGYLDQCRIDWDRAHPEVSYAASHIQKVIVFTDGTDNASKARGVSDQDLISAYLTRRDAGPLAGRFFLKVVTVPGVTMDLGDIPVEHYGFQSRPVEVTCTPTRLDFGDLLAGGTGSASTLVVELHAQRPIPRTAIDCGLEVKDFDSLSGARPVQVTLSPEVMEGGPTDLTLAVSLAPTDVAALEAAARLAGRSAFEGTLTLSAADPSVEFLPYSLAVTFAAGAAGTVTITPALGNDGVLRGPRRGQGEQTVLATYYLDFDRLAKASNLLVRADFSWASDGGPADLSLTARRAGVANPSLVTFVAWSEGQPLAPGPVPSILDASTTRLDVLLTVPVPLDTALPAGDYPGNLVLTALTPGRLVGPDQESEEAVAARGQDGRLSLAIRFHLGRAPLPSWAAAGLGLAGAIVGAALFSLSRPPFRPKHRLKINRHGQPPRVVSLWSMARRGFTGYRVDLGSGITGAGLRWSVRPAGPAEIVLRPVSPRLSGGPASVREGSRNPELRVNGAQVMAQTRAGKPRFPAQRLKHGAVVTYGDLRLECDFY